MTLTELQLPSKTDFYRVIQAIATEIVLKKNSYDLKADFIDGLDTSDLDAMQVPTTGTLRQDLVDFKVMLNELISHLEGNTVVPTKPAIEVLNKLRSL